MESFRVILRVTMTTSKTMPKFHISMIPKKYRALYCQDFDPVFYLLTVNMAIERLKGHIIDAKLMGSKVSFVELHIGRRTPLSVTVLPNHEGPFEDLFRTSAPRYHRNIKICHLSGAEIIDRIQDYIEHYGYVDEIP